MKLSKRGARVIPRKDASNWHVQETFLAEASN